MIYTEVLTVTNFIEDAKDVLALDFGGTTLRDTEYRITCMASILADEMDCSTNVDKWADTARALLDVAQGVA